MPDTKDFGRIMADLNSSQEPEWLIQALQGKTVFPQPDGSVSTVRTIGFNADGHEMVAPTIRVLGGEPQQLTNREAIDLAMRQGDAVKFDSIDEANAYSRALHEDHARRDLKYTGPRRAVPDWYRLLQEVLEK